MIIETDPSDNESYNNRVPLNVDFPYIIRRKRDDDVNASPEDLKTAKYVLVEPKTGDIINCDDTIRGLIASCLPTNNWPFVFDEETAVEVYDLLCKL